MNSRSIVASVWVIWIANLQIFSRAATLPAEEDTGSTTGRITASVGKAVALPVNAGCKAYIFFDLRDVSAAHADEIKAARLRLYLPAIWSQGRGLDVFKVTSPWDEALSSYEPTLAPMAVAHFPAATLGRKRFVSVDVTNTVREWVKNPESNEGFAIGASQPNSARVLIGTKEGSASGYPAQLEVDLNSTDPTVTGSQIVEGAVGTTQLAPNLTLGGVTNGTFTGNGAGLKNIDAANLTGTLSFTPEGQAASLGHVHDGTGSLGVAMDGEYVYVANDIDGLRIYNISDPANPKATGHVPQSAMGGGDAYGVSVVGATAFLANYSDGVRIIDVSNRANPVPFAHIPESKMGGGEAYGLTILGNYIYVANADDGFRIVDISQISNPEVKGFIPAGRMGDAEAYGVAAIGNYAYLANDSDGLRVIDVTSATNPRIVAHIPEIQMGGGLAAGVTVDGSYVYVANGYDGVRIIDVSDPLKPVIIAWIPQTQIGNGYANGVAVAGNYAYIANHDGGVRILEVSDPSNPVVKGGVRESEMGGGNAYGIAVSKDYAAVANYYDGLRILGIASARAPSFHGDGSELTIAGSALSSVLDAKVAKSGDTMTGILNLPSDGLAIGETQLVTRRGNVGIGRVPVANQLEVDGEASKSTSGGWALNSDQRIKFDIRPIVGALDRIDRLRPVVFRYTKSYRQTHSGIIDRDYFNVIAQEFSQVFPDDVKGSGEMLPDGSEILQVDTYSASITALAAIRELHAQMRSKDDEIATLRRRLDALELKSQPIESPP